MGLILYNDTTDATSSFLTWRTDIDGPAISSNFYLIDTAITADRVRLTALESKSVVTKVSATYTSGSLYNATVASITSYADKMLIALTLNQTNPGTTQLQINALATIALVKVNTVGTSINLAANDLRPNRINLFMYDIGSTTWIWVGSTAADTINITGTSQNVVIVNSTNGLDGSLTQSLMLSQTTHSATGKTTPADLDEFPLIDTASSNILKKITWANMKTILTNLGSIIVAASAQLPVGSDIFGYAYNVDSTTKKATFQQLTSQFGIYINSLTAKTTLAVSDAILLMDSATSNVSKQITMTNFWGAMGAFVDGFTNKGTPVGADEIPLSDSSTSFSIKKLSLTNLVIYLKTAIATDTLAAPTNITTNNASSTAHGFSPITPADATKFLNGAATPAYTQVKDSDLSTTDITTNNVSTSKHGFTPKQLFAAQAYLTPWVVIQKTVDETIVSSVSLQADDMLLFTMAASTKYFIRGKIFFDTGATEDFKFRFANTGTSAIVRSVINSIPAGSTTSTITVETSFPTTTTSVVGTGTTNGYVDFMFLIQNTTSGTFRLDWAQNTSGITNTTILAGSYLEYQAS